jgi:hypothetical protein
MLLALLFSGSTSAAEPGAAASTTRPRPVAGWPIVELRAGAAVAPAPGGVLCGEVSPYRLLAFEACGSGSGFLYPASPDATDMAHFRVEGNIPVYRRGRAELVVQPGAGFAEVQRGQDAPGFRFGRARSADQHDGAGAEVSVGAKGRGWLSERVYVTSEISAGAAWIPSAPVVLGSAPATPFLGATIGAGF